MKSYEIKDRSGIWKGLLTMAPFIGASVFLGSAGAAACICALICGTFVSSIIFYSCMQTKVFSEKGFYIQTLFHTKAFSWDQIEKVGIIRLYRGKYISLVSAPIPEKSWVQYWFWWMKLENRPGVLFPYDKKLYAIITEFYGPLDFDLPGGREEA